MESPQKIFDEIRQIKSQWKAEINGAHKQWPAAIRDRVSALLASKEVTIREISEETGISSHTVAAWSSLNRRVSGFKEVAILKAKPSKKVVTVTDTKTSRKPSKDQNSTNFVSVTVRTSAGDLYRFRYAKDAAFVMSQVQRDKR